ncbi:cell division protein PerM [Ornithinimicrobium sp. W1665]|uniref:cell division protein PerM n=1 Tax=Ornithinimicrobium sp. W1665 TaxID=3416666 RepID=UPI003CF2ABA8
MTVLQRPETVPDPGPRDRPDPRPRGLTAGRLVGLLLAVLSGAACVLLGAIAVALPTVVTWVADERSTASFWQTLGASVDVWALAHRAQVRADGTDVVLAPLALTALLVGVCAYAAHQVVLTRTDLRSRVPRIGGWRAAWHALGGDEAVAFVLGYAVAALLLAHTASFGVAPVWLPSLLPGALLVPALAVLGVWWAEHRRADHPVVDAGLRWMTRRTPTSVRRAAAPAVEVLVGFSAVAFLMVLGLLLMRGDRVLALYAALDAGWVGTVVLTLAQLLVLPNLMVWALAWLAGAGVHVGTVHVGWTGSTPGDLPLLPVLGALPEPGALPPGLWAMALVPLVAGGWLGHRVAGSAPRLSTWWSKAATALVGAATVALVALLLGWLSSGGLTPGLLGTVGVRPWHVAGLLGAEVAVGALLVVSVRHLVGRGRLGRR